MNNLVNYFIPDELIAAQNLETRRAELVVKLVFLLVVFGTPFGLLYHVVLGATAATVGVIVGVALALLAPVVLRKTGQTQLAGQFLLTPLYLILLWISALTGGLFAPGAAWVMLIPLLAILIFGVRMAGIWLVIVLVTWLGAYGLELMGHSFGQNLYADHADELRLIELLSVGSIVFGLMFIKDNIEQWLIEQVRLRERKTRAVLQTAPDGILNLKVDGTIRAANDAAAQIFGRDRQELVGADIRSLIVDLSIDDFDENTEFGNTQELLGRRNHNSFPLEVAFGLLDDHRGEQEGVVLVLRDITERKTAERQLRQARDEAMEASKAKSTFLANMSHELRTPLNAVIGYSEMLLEEVNLLAKQDAASADVVSDFAPDLKRIHTAGNHLLALINDILDLSKIEAGKMQINVESVDLGELCDDIAGTVRPLADSNDNELIIEIADDIGMTMYSDPTKVRQILFNLLSNACKFTDSGTVRLAVDYDEDDDQFSFLVEDSGIGMSEEEIEKVFEAFSQADASTTRQFGGTGLGLTITSHFCSLLDGSIDVESTPGEGTAFTVRLAADIRDKQNCDTDDTAPSEGGRNSRPTRGSAAEIVDAVDSDAQTVLVVDDDPTIRDLVGRMLTAEGFEVVTAASGSEGLALAEKLRPSAITLDVMMPSMDGWTMLEKLKQNPDTADIPVVMVSMLAEQRRGYALGADDYLVKPVDKTQLIKVLDNLGVNDRSSGHILIVEDDEPTRSLMRRVLQKDDWSVTEAENGARALEAVQEQAPNLVLLDLMMPEMDGFQFLHQFRADEDHRDTPVVVVTAKELTEAERTQLTADVEDILGKAGRDRDELLDDIRRMVLQLVEQ